MPPDIPIQALALIVGAFLLLGVLASKASTKLGLPALVIFLVIGMVAGSEGLGGIEFSDAALAQAIGSVALAAILFAGGLDTNWKTVRPVIWSGLSLSTIGVALTAGLVAAFAHYVLAFEPLPAMILGAVVSSTDAAAVFGVLRSRSTRLKQRLTAMLEFESGSNDPLAVFLTLGLISIALEPSASVVSLIPKFLIQMPIGVVTGVLVARGCAWLINHLRLEYDGLYAILTIAGASVAFGGAHVLGGNEFLSVYICGLTLSSRNFVHRIALTQFHDAIAWLMQITMFVVLGLLVFPSQLAKIAATGILLSLFLMFVARPVAVFISLAFSRMRKRARFFVAWAGLRGAVPIVLATFPLTMGVPGADQIFNLVFFVVMTSVIIQGTTLGVVAKWLGVAKGAPSTPDHLTPARGDELMEIEVLAGSPAAGRQVVELNLPAGALLVLLKRGGESYIPRGSTVLLPADVLLVATRRQDQADLRARLQGDLQPELAIPD